jgi:hypothetical protein
MPRKDVALRPAVSRQSRSYKNKARQRRAMFEGRPKLLRLDGDECEAEPAQTVRKYGKRVPTKQSRRISAKVVSRSPGTAYTTMAASFRT